MTKQCLRLLVLAAAVALAGCSSAPLKELQSWNPFQSKGEPALSQGVQDYENGRYREAEQSLKRSLDLGLSSKEEVQARKYLAFIDCTSNREKQCREEFTRILEIDPGFELSPAEAGHPLWGPVFRSVKAKIRK